MSKLRAEEASFFYRHPIHLSPLPSPIPHPSSQGRGRNKLASSNIRAQGPSDPRLRFTQGPPPRCPGVDAEEMEHVRG
eukprot:4989299-Pyramimonas_sp.AAC.1